MFNENVEVGSTRCVPLSTCGCLGTYGLDVAVGKCSVFFSFIPSGLQDLTDRVSSDSSIYIYVHIHMCTVMSNIIGKNIGASCSK